MSLLRKNLCQSRSYTDHSSIALEFVRKAGVASIPGSTFSSHPELGVRRVRFCFSKKIETWEAAAKRRRMIRPYLSGPSIISLSFRRARYIMKVTRGGRRLYKDVSLPGQSEVWEADP